jgi:hypothetical protein
MSAVAVPPTFVVVRYGIWPTGVGFTRVALSIDAEPPLEKPPEDPYAELAYSASSEGKALVEFLHADQELAGLFRIMRLDFVTLLQNLSAIYRDRAMEIIADPLPDPLPNRRSDPHLHRWLAIPTTRRLRRQRLS